MNQVEQARPTRANLHWLAMLLTGCSEIAAKVTAEAVPWRGNENLFFSNWMSAWSRRLVIAKALAAVRHDLAASVRQMALRPNEKHPELPARPWRLDRGAGKKDLQRALLAMDMFPRAAVLLLLFERVPLTDASVLLGAQPDLVRKAQAVGVVELTTHLARMQGWQPGAVKPEQLAGRYQHA